MSCKTSGVEDMGRRELEQTQEVITAREEEEEGLHRPDTTGTEERPRRRQGLARSAAVLVKAQIEKTL